MTQGYDIALYVIAGNSLVTWIPRLAGQVTVLNVDGLDWKREKWPGPAKAYIRFAERMATVLPTVYLTDSRVVQGYYRDTYGSEPPYIPYGSAGATGAAGRRAGDFRVATRAATCYSWAGWCPKTARITWWRRSAGWTPI